MLSSILDQMALLLEGVTVIRVSESVSGSGCGESGWVDACISVHEFISLLAYCKVKISSLKKINHLNTALIPPHGFLNQKF